MEPECSWLSSDIKLSELISKYNFLSAEIQTWESEGRSEFGNAETESNI